jgi:hypothetical protein
MIINQLKSKNRYHNLLAQKNRKMIKNKQTNHKI